MPDILNTSVSGLLTYQRALATTSHNIANINTEGFSRQRTNLSTRIPELSGAGYIGTGVKANSVTRIYDQFLVEQLRSYTSGMKQLETFYDYSSQVDNLLADPNAGLAPAIQDFFNALNGVANTPSSIPAREVLLNQADSLVFRFQAIDGRLASLRDTINTATRNTVNDINALSKSIADINQSIVLARARAGGEPPNDLLDQRDELIRQLSERVQVTATEQDNGAMNIFIGNGQVMVLGMDYNQLNAVPSDYDSFDLRIVLDSRSGKGADVTDFLKGGALGGLQSFRKEILEPAQNALGRIALGLADTLNSQHMQGLDLDNELGQAMFGFAGVTALASAAASSRNDGTAGITYTIDDVTKLSTSDYRIDTADGENFVVTRLSDRKIVGAYTHNPGDPDPTINVADEGFSFTINDIGNIQAGDSFELQPTRAAARDIRMLLDDTKQIAAAAPLRANESVANLGSGQIDKLDFSAQSSSDLAGVLLAGDITLTFDPDSAGAPPVPGYVVSVGGNPLGRLDYDSATENIGKVFDLGDLDPDYAGISFRLSGVPLEGDSFTVAKSIDSVSDGGNALKLAAIDGQPLLAGGTTTLQNSYGQMVSQVGARTHRAEIDLGVQQSMVTQAQQAVESVSGVNLDEEAANMLKFQQAYQATAQLIGVAQSLFDTLLNSVRR